MVDQPIILLKGSRGETPLFIAADRGYLNIVRILLAAGAEVGLETDASMYA